MMKKLSIALIISLTILAGTLAAGDNGLNLARMQGYKALKVFVQIKDEQIVTSDFLEYETENFIIKYRPEDENIVRETAYMFEESYDVMAKKYGHASNSKTVVVIYKDQEEFWKYQDVIQGQAVMGLYNMGTIHILSPNAYNPQRQTKMEYFRKNGPVLHEYTHKVLDEMTNGNIELWLTEGLALYEEYDENNVQWAPSFVYERYLSSQEMRAGFMYADEVQSYRQSFDMISYLVDKLGMESIQQLLSELKKGSSSNDAFLKVYGVTADQFIDSKVYSR